MDELFNEIETARNHSNELFALLTRGGTEVERPRPILEGASLSDFRRRTELLLDILQSLRPEPSDDTTRLVLGVRVPELRTQLQAYINHAHEAKTQLSANWRESTKLIQADESLNLHLADASGNYAQVDLNGQFKRMRVQIRDLYGLVGNLLPFCKANGAADLSARVEALGAIARQSDALRGQAEASAKSAAEQASRIESTEKSVRELASAAESLVAAIREAQTKATADGASMAALVEQIKTTGAAASALQVQVDGYKPKFDAFQAELDSRNQEFVRFQESSKAAEEKNKAREEEIDRLMKTAEAMISGATTAGLANSLELTRKRYEDRMNGARIGFIVSVVLLVVSALPLAAHLLPGVLGDWFPKAAEGAHSSWYGVLGKVLLMVPATWLTGFYTKTYADFFHLEREYAHKAALAMSVDGFKRQAPKYEEEITAEVFLEIRNNPAKGKNVEPAGHPLYDVLTKMVEKVGRKD